MITNNLNLEFTGPRHRARAQPFDLSLPRRQLRHPDVGVHILDIGHDLVPGNVEFHIEQRITAAVSAYELLVVKVLDSEWSALRTLRFRVQPLRPEAVVMVA